MKATLKTDRATASLARKRTMFGRRGIVASLAVLSVLGVQTTAFASITTKHSCTVASPVTTTRLYTSALESAATSFEAGVQSAILSTRDETPAAFYAADPNDTRYSSSDWWQIVKSIPKSSILREIKGPVLSVVAWSTLVSIIHRVLISLGKGNLASRMIISGKPHTLLVSSLGLLLVFRTNSAYQRFAEGRKIWEQILSISRSFSRTIKVYEKDVTEVRALRVQRLLAAFPYLLRHHIQPQCLGKAECEAIKGNPNGIRLHEPKPAAYSKNRRSRCSPSEDCWVDRRSLPWSLLPNIALRKCVNSKNRPLWICDRLAEELVSVPYSPNFTSRERWTFLGQIDKLSKCIGECERIHQTAVPLNYARHSLRSLTVWLFSLPFALIGELGLLTGPVMGLTAWLLFGVYQIGYTIEDPFQGSLRLTALCDAIYRDVMHGTQGSSFMWRDDAFSMDEELDEWGSMMKPSISYQCGVSQFSLNPDIDPASQVSGDAIP